MALLPLYTSDEGGSVLVCSDTWPGAGGVLGRTRAQIEAARRENIRPAGGGGFAYMQGPDDALVEIAGNYPAERLNHVHLYQEDPLAALGCVPDAPQRAAARQFRQRTGDRGGARGAARARPHLAVASPRGDVPLAARGCCIRWRVDDVVPEPGPEPLTGSRGQLQDHIGLSVADLDAWREKLEREGVALLEGPYRLGDTRALMLRGPSAEVLELVEVR